MPTMKKMKLLKQNCQTLFEREEIEWWNLARHAASFPNGRIATKHVTRFPKTTVNRGVCQAKRKDFEEIESHVYETKVS